MAHLPYEGLHRRIPLPGLQLQRGGGARLDRERHMAPTSLEPQAVWRLRDDMQPHAAGAEVGGGLRQRLGDVNPVVTAYRMRVPPRRRVGRALAPRAAATPPS